MERSRANLFETFLSKICCRNCKAVIFFYLSFDYHQKNFSTFPTFVFFQLWLHIRYIQTLRNKKNDSNFERLFIGYNRFNHSLMAIFSFFLGFRSCYRFLYLRGFMLWPKFSELNFVNKISFLEISSIVVNTSYHSYITGKFLKWFLKLKDIKNREDHQLPSPCFPAFYFQKFDKNTIWHFIMALRTYVKQVNTIKSLEQGLQTSPYDVAVVY